MSELNPKLPKELEEGLAKYHATPTPSAGFAAQLELELRRKVRLTQPENKPLERKSFMKTLRARPALAILIALLILLALSGVAYAIGKSLGYIPGLGIIDRSAPLRVLAEPVSQTYVGITVTVKEAVISIDKTLITFTIENIPTDKLSPINQSTCKQWPELRLADGTSLGLTGGEGNLLATTYEMRLIYQSIPVDINDAILVIHCIDRATPGVLPEDWEVPLRFVSAPINMTVVPVMEVTSVFELGMEKKNPLTITNIIDIGDSYVLIGEFRESSPPNESDSGSIGLRVTDGNGEDIPFEGFPQDIVLPTPTSPNSEVWSVKFDKGFISPIYITYTKQYIFADSSQMPVKFEFDAGENPQTVQSWKMNKEFTLAGRVFTLDSVNALPNSYEFNFTSKDNGIYSVDVVIDDYPPDINGGGMDAIMVGASGSWSTNVGPYKELPTGLLKVSLSHLWFIGELREWTIDWHP